MGFFEPLLTGFGISFSLNNLLYAFIGLQWGPPSAYCPDWVLGQPSPFSYP